MRLFVPFLFLSLAACVSPRIDYLASADFSAYQQVQLLHDTDAPRSLDGARVVSALGKYLPKRGLALRETSAALQLRYALTEYSRFDVNEVFWGFGASHQNNIAVGVSAPISAEETKQFRLVLELIDVNTKQVVWSARSANGLDEDASSARREKWIDKQVRLMLEKFPPAVRD